MTGRPDPKRDTPPPGRDFLDAYASGDPIKIAVARAKYSDELIAVGLPPLDEPLDFTKAKTGDDS